MLFATKATAMRKQLAAFIYWLSDLIDPTTKESFKNYHPYDDEPINPQKQIRQWVTVPIADYKYNGPRANEILWRYNTSFTQITRAKLVCRGRYVRLKVVTPTCEKPMSSEDLRRIKYQIKIYVQNIFKWG